MEDAEPYWKSSGDPVLPEWLHFNGFEPWVVREAAIQYLRTDGAVLLLPDEIMKRPKGWKEAVERYVNIFHVARPPDKNQGNMNAGE